MAKPPVWGKAKTRLAEDIGPDKALGIYERLLEHTLQVAEVCAADVTVFQAFENASFRGFDGFKVKMQEGEDLGQRMAHAFQSSAFPAVMIGTDCPALSSDLLQEAFEALNTNDVVLGPANDGGYYLIGMRTWIPSLLEGIAWSTEKVLAQTLEAAKNAHLRTVLLDEQVDIDTFADLEATGFARDILQSEN